MAPTTPTPTTTMALENPKLHIIIFPWLAFGHMIPYLELSRCLAKRGHHISFISTPRNIDRLPTNLSPLIKLIKLNPPSIHGLPENVQSTIDVPVDQNHFLKKLLDGLEAPLCSFLEQDPSPNWIIYDLLNYWVPRVAHKFKLPCAYFSVLSGAAHSFIGPPSVLLGPTSDSSLTLEKLLDPPPWIPFQSNVRFRYHEAMQMLKRSKDDDSGLPPGYRIGSAIQESNIVLIRSCPEIESEWLGLLGELYQKPVIPVGLLPPSIEDINDCDGGKWEDGEWLNTQKKSSAVYVAFGSELVLTKEQVHELAFGLELSELPFVWAYRGDPILLPMGFEDRTRGMGLVIKGWAPQPRFLAHPSVGGFLMHGGWGSAIEALTYGKPLIMVPMIMDQGLNTRVMEEKKVGVELARNERDGSFTRDAVAKALRLVLVEAEGGPIRVSAEKMRKIVGDKSLNDCYLDGLVTYLLEHKSRVRSI